jgi:integrase
MVKQSLRTADPRTRLMILLAAYAGLRCAEIAQVAGHHFDGLWLDVTGKGGKHRRVPVIHPELVHALTATPGPLFPSPARGREHLTPGTVTKLLSRSLPAHWTGHTLRHRMATRAYQANGDLIHLGLVLGHARPETTRRYVQPSEDKMLAVIRAAAG